MGPHHGRTPADSAAAVGASLRGRHGEVTRLARSGGLRGVAQGSSPRRLTPGPAASRRPHCLGWGLSTGESSPRGLCWLWHLGQGVAAPGVEWAETRAGCPPPPSPPRPYAVPRWPLRELTPPGGWQWRAEPMGLCPVPLVARLSSGWLTLCPRQDGHIGARSCSTGPRAEVSTGTWWESSGETRGGESFTSESGTGPQGGGWDPEAPGCRSPGFVLLRRARGISWKVSERR